MAKGFALMTKLQAEQRKSTLAERFESVFQGAKFVASTWGKQTKAWKGSRLDEHDQARVLPRTEAGLWTEWRKGCSGWAKMYEDKT